MAGKGRTDRGTVRARAEGAVALVLIDRTAAEREAERVVASASPAADAPALAMAHRVLASVNLHRGQLREAETHIELSISAARSSNEPELLGLALMTQMGLLVVRGDAAKAIEISYEAEPLLPPPMQVRLAIQRATALGLGLGHAAEAVRAFDDVAEAHPDLEPQTEAVLRMNRGTQLLATGELRRAMADFGRARLLYKDLGNVEAECDVLIHETMLAARVGDFPRVFTLEAEVRERNLLATSDARTLNDLADALLAAGLLDEAGALSEQALAVSSAEEGGLSATQAALRCAEVRLQLGRPAQALALAREVAARAASHDHDVLISRAEYVAVMAEADTVQPSVRHVSRLRELAEQLESDGWVDHGADSRIAAATFALAAGSPATVESLLATIPTPDTAQFRKSPAPWKARCRHAHALRHIAGGRPALARRQLSAGLAEIDRMRSSIGAADVRAAASDRAPELARLGLRLALGARVPRSILLWAEKSRAGANRMANPAGGSEIVDEGAVDALRSSTATGADRRVLEGSVTSAARRHRQHGTGTRASSPGEIAALVGDRTLLEFIELDAMLHLIVIRRGRVRFIPQIASIAHVEAALARLLFGLRRVLLGGPSGDAASAMVQAVAAELDDLLLGCLRGHRHRDLVIVPTGSLHRLPWGALPSTHDRRLTVAPSAHLWAQAESREPRGAHVVAVSGPDLPEAAAELASIALLRPTASLRQLPSVATVLGDLRAADAIHIAAHGTVRTDNASFSSLRLADGPLFVYDLERLASVPSLIILSACSVGSSKVLAGDDVLGFPAAVLAGGARSLIASLLPVEDLAARDLMVALHAELENGLTPAAALARAARSTEKTSPQHRATAMSFLCFGAS